MCVSVILCTERKMANFSISCFREHDLFVYAMARCVSPSSSTTANAVCWQAFGQHFCVVGEPNTNRVSVRGRVKSASLLTRSTWEVVNASTPGLEIKSCTLFCLLAFFWWPKTKDYGNCHMQYTERNDFLLSWHPFICLVRSFRYRIYKYETVIMS